jgi:Icc-related predicted phosphoesterase
VPSLENAVAQDFCLLNASVKKMVNFSRIIGSLAIFLCLLWACSDPFHYSPFETTITDALRHTTQQNLDRIEQFDTAFSKPFKIALISDSHYHFNDLTDAITDINRKKEFAFIIVTGDITENGLLREFEIFHKIMSRSQIPYVTVIGNHDHLSNGAAIYQQMFGPLNYSFTFHHVKFVAWDNTIWESEKDADYAWLNNALKADIEDERLEPPYHHIIPLSHIPPFDGQLVEKQPAFHELLRKHKVSLSIHGHKHEFFLGELYGDGIQYMTVGSPQKRNYASLYVTPTEISVSKIVY